MGLEHASRDKKLPMVNFLIFGQMNIYIKGFQKMKIHTLKGFEKFAFLFLPIIKSGPRKGQNTPKSDFRGQKYPPGCKFNMKHVVLYVGHLYKQFWTKKI